MNRGARKVNIAVDDKSKSWNNIKSSIFPEYFFHCTVDKQKGTEEGAKITMDLIENNQNLLAYNDVGGDPYLRPFLYLYVADVPSRGISEDMKDEISNWIEKNKMAMTTYLVILIQDDKAFSSKIVKGAEFAIDENIIIIRYNKNKPLQTNFVEEIRNATRDAIVKDFNAYNNEGKERIHHLASNPKSQMRLKVWRHLLLYSFGFCDTALEGFSKLYNKMITDQTFDCTLDDLLKIQIDIDQITDHPIVSDNTVYLILSFVLHGIFSVSYNRFRFENISTFFFKQYSLIRSKCITKEDNIKVNEWGEKSIDTILKLPQFISQTSISSHILFTKFLLLIKRTGDDVEKVYEKYRSLLRGFKNTIAAMDTLYVLYFQKSPKQSIDLGQFIGWNMASEATEILINNIINRGDSDLIVQLAKSLLSDRSLIKNKREIFEKIVELNKSHSLSSLFRASFSFESDAFLSEIPAGRPFIINVKFRGAKWLPENFDEAKLQLKITRQGKIDIFTSKSTSLNGNISFRVFFRSPGVRDFSEFSLKYGELVLKWPLSTVYQIRIGNHGNVPIHLDTPRIIVPSEPLKLMIRMDFSNTMVTNCNLQMNFEDNNSVIPQQEGDFTYIDTDEEKVKEEEEERKVTSKFSIDEDGNFTFKNENEDEEFSPSLKILTMPITFTVKSLTNKKSNLIINLKMDHHSVQDQFSILCNFPLKIQIRLKTEEVVHLTLTNVCDIPLTITSDDIGEAVVESDKIISVIHPTDQELFTVTVSGMLDEKITQSWNINDDILYPKIDLKILNHNHERFWIGSAINVQLTLPECKFKFIQNKNVVIVGLLYSDHFEGGTLNVKFIPVKVGVSETPNIEINDVLFTLHPRFIQVTSSSTLSLGPFVSNSNES